MSRLWTSPPSSIGDLHQGKQSSSPRWAFSAKEGEKAEEPEVLHVIILIQSPGLITRTACLSLPDAGTSPTNSKHIKINCIAASVTLPVGTIDVLTSGTIISVHCFSLALEEKHTHKKTKNQNKTNKKGYTVLKKIYSVTIMKNGIPSVVL